MPTDKWQIYHVTTNIGMYGVLVPPYEDEMKERERVEHILDMHVCVVPRLFEIPMDIDHNQCLN